MLKNLVEGLEAVGGQIKYKSRVTRVFTVRVKAVGVKLADGNIYYAKRIISNATRWDTFNKLLSDNLKPC